MKLLGDRRNFDRLMTMRRHLVVSPTVPNLMLHACLLVICNLCVHMSTGFFGIFFLKKFLMASLIRLFRFFLYRSLLVMSIIFFLKVNVTVVFITINISFNT